MKTLILIRHAKTEQLTNNSKSDFERKLLPRGHSDAELIANILKDKAVNPDLIITSTAKRTRQTAKIFAEQLNYPEDKIAKEDFIYHGYTTNQMLNYIAKVGQNSDVVMIIAHNPEIADFTLKMCNGYMFHFPTCFAAVISFEQTQWEEVEARSGKLDFFTYPSLVR